MKSLHPAPHTDRLKSYIKSTGRLPVTNLPSCGKVVPEPTRG
jgi:hypothetical protein